MVRSMIGRSAMALVAAVGLAVSMTSTEARGQGVKGGAGATESGAATNLPIRRITLYRSGVGYFEREGQIDGNAEIQLRFKTDQINDILKSMYLVDLGGGRVDSVSYGSKEPLARRLASFGVNIASNPSIPDLLGQLRGAPIKVLVSTTEVSGTILGIENRMMPPAKDREPVPVPYLNLVTATGLKSIAIPEIASFEIQDKELAAELNKALATLAEYRADRTKTVDLRFAGQGQRRAFVSYVHEMPVWKTSYRLVIPDAGKDSASAGKKELMLQGWAIVENTTDEDWGGVNLALVSGRPVSFQMDLYEPLFTTRPFLPVPTIPGVNPRIYGAGMDGEVMVAAEKAMDEARVFKADRMEAGRRGLAEAPGRPAAAPAPAMAKAGAGGGGANYAFSGVAAADMADAAGQSQAQAAEVGEVFQYQLSSPVTIDRQRSAMIPIIGSGIEGRRVSIYNPGDNAEHPMRGVEIVNQTDLQLLPGPMSVYDGAAYAGDAQIGHIAKGDKRLLAYAMDLDVNVVTKTETDSDIVKLKIVNGTFEQTTKSRMRTTYAFDNKDGKRGRDLVVEQGKMPGWTLVDPKKPAEETQALYRFDLAVEPGKIGTMNVVFERVDGQSIGVTSIDLPTLLGYHKAGKISDAVLAAVREVGKRQGEINDTQRQIGDLSRQSDEIAKEQGRIRENMGRIDRTDPLYSRYVKKLADQENQLEDLRDKREKAQSKLEQQTNDLNAYLRALNVE